MSIWIVNNKLTCIPGTQTFWHLLLDIPGTVDKTGYNFRQLADVVDADKGQPDVIVRNASFFRKLNRSEKTIAFFQDLPRTDQKDEVVFSADCVVFNSNYTASAYHGDLGKIKRMEIIPIGVNTEVFAPQNLRLVPDPPVGIFVGDYNSTKNTQLFEAIVRRRKDVQFFYVSKKGNRIRWPNVINVTGGVDEKRMADLYNRSDFILMCSPVETLHLASVEAAMCDKPVIATKTGWVASHFDKTVGIVIEHPTVDEFSKAIDHVRDNRNEFSPRRYMKTTPFAWESCRAAWEKLIGEL